jgi:hypothetical protein
MALMLWVDGQHGEHNATRALVLSYPKADPKSAQAQLQRQLFDQ